MAMVWLFARSSRALHAGSTKRLFCCVCFSGTPDKIYHSSALPTNKSSVRLGGFDPGGDYRDGQKRLWEDLFSNASEWWDNRLHKKSPQHPDFRHKRSREPLWLDNEYKPMWVDSQIAIVDAQNLQRSSLHGNFAYEVRTLCEEGQLDKVLMLLQQGTVPSVNVCSFFLKACAKRKALVQAKRIQVYLARYGLDSTSSIGECMVSTLVKCGGLEDALQVFHKLPHRSVFAWTAVLSGHTSLGQGQEALRMYHRMLKEGVDPDKYTFVILLKACGSLSDLEEGKHIHAEASKYRLDSDQFVGTCLVDMYAKCGSLVDAYNVFEGLSQRNVVSWTVMLGAYVQQGQTEKAFQLYDQMQEDDVCPNDRTFVILLQACRMLVDKEESADGQSNKVLSLEKGKTIHADSQRKGYDSDVFVGNALVSMYGKCGNIVAAKKVFNGLTQRDVVSWNAMLGAYVEQGHLEEALQLYDRMHEEGVSPNERSFVSALQACGMLAEADEDDLDGQSTTVHYLEKGKAIHADAQRKHHNSNIFVGSTLISMYGKCRSILDAEGVFHSLSRRNLVTWNAMLTAYVQQGQAEQALQFYNQMYGDHVSPDIRTFVTILQACGMLAEKEKGVVLGGQLTKVKSLELGKAIHAEAQRKGSQFDNYIGNTLVSMYGKCGSSVDAQSVFYCLSQRDVMSWTAMLAAYTQQGEVDKALELFEQMSHESVRPDLRVLVILLQVCGMLADKEDCVVVDGRFTKLKSLKMGKAMHADIWRKGYGSNVIIGNTLVSVYGKSGSVLDALNVFEGLCHKDVVSWNAMLTTYTQQGPAEKALLLYEEMSDEGLSPDVWTFVSVVQACGTVAEKEEYVIMDGQSIRAKSLEASKEMHANARLRGYDLNVFIANTLVTVYGKCGSVLDAHNVFAHLTDRDVVSWNAILGAYAEQGEVEKALQLFEQMAEEGVHHDEVTLMCILQACSNTGNLDVCRQIHHILLCTGYDISPLLASTLIHAYGSCASMVDAQAVFDALPHPDVVLWTALITGYARQGDSIASLQWYEKMRLDCIKPDSVTFLSLLCSCSHAGLVDKGIEYFESMSRDYGITPGIEHYVCIVDLLGRAGYFTRVEQLLSSLPLQPDRAMLSCLLGACQKHGKVVLGMHAFELAVHLKSNNAAPYVLMSNIYEAAGLGDQAKDLKALSQKAGAWKKPGQSWIEHQQEMHSFMVGDSGHTQHEQLYDLMGKVRRQCTPVFDGGSTYNGRLTGPSLLQFGFPS